MDLAQLISQHLRTSGESYRDLEKRARDAGHPLSRSRFNTYAKPGRLRALPSEETRQALAAGLEVSTEAVTAAALESAGVDDAMSDGRSLRHAEAWLKLTEGRTEQEVEHLLGVVAATLRAMEATKGSSPGAAD